MLQNKFNMSAEWQTRLLRFIKNVVIAKKLLALLLKYVEIAVSHFSENFQKKTKKHNLRNPNWTCGNPSRKKWNIEDVVSILIYIKI